jgi:hypothetical protein
MVIDMCLLDKKSVSYNHAYGYYKAGCGPAGQQNHRREFQVFRRFDFVENALKL